VSEPEEDGEAHTLGLLKELRALADEIGHGHMDYAHKFHELLQTIKNPNLPDVAKDFSFRILSCNEFGGTERTIAVSSNITIAIAAWQCACKIFPNDRWLLLWGGMVQYDSAKEKQTRPRDDS
jgi:hypothetical protein